MEPIGGYFSLELPRLEEYHKHAIRLNTGRNSLEYILRTRKYHKVYIPYYTCDVTLEPFQKLGVAYEFYHIDLNLEIRDHITLKEGEALLYVNYYGLKQRYVETLAVYFGSHLIVDNTQAFYAKPINRVDTFYTCRKFFGVPDGAYVYMGVQVNTQPEYLEQDISYGRMDSLTKRIDMGAEAGYADFRQTSHKLIGQSIKSMSRFTRRMMESINYDSAARQRRANFQHLHQALGDRNNLTIPLETDAVPMVYPYLTPIKSLREKLIESKIFVARYWPNVLNWTSEEELEYLLSFQMLPLPIDQRYGRDEMDIIIRQIDLCAK